MSKLTSQELRELSELAEKASSKTSRKGMIGPIILFVIGGLFCLPLLTAIGGNLHPGMLGMPFMGLIFIGIGVFLMMKNKKQQHSEPLTEILERRPGDIVWVYLIDKYIPSNSPLMNEQRIRQMNIVTKEGYFYQLNMQHGGREKIFDLMDKHCENAYMGWAFQIITNYDKPNYADAAKRIMLLKQKEGTKGSYEVCMD